MERNAVITTHRPTHVGGGTTQDLEIYESVLEPADEALAPPGSDGTVVCYQYVVLSPTFQVPTFYFSVHDSGALPRHPFRYLMSKIAMARWCTTQFIGYHADIIVPAGCV